ncbi:MAG: hypothetical protein HZA52_12075 [Planctomycetes bacterium]|nr:hypothetical protein [Planctomycetota bacterium]
MSAGASDVTIVGSGASAVHFVQTALDRGLRVTMVDVGRPRPAPVRPDDSFAKLKAKLDDPWRYFLGSRFESVLFPGKKGEYYGFPPHKEYIFEGVDDYAVEAQGFEPLASFARGGLAEAWTGGSFPFNDDELEDFPFRYDELGPFYDEIARRIGIVGADDDLARFMPVHRHLDAPLDLDRHAALLLERYAKVRERMNADGAFFGRSRAAVLREDRDGRKGCDYLGRCLWTCPRESLYTPAMTLERLLGRPGFTYLDRRFVTHFRFESGKVRALAVVDLATRRSEELDVERLVLAAGTLPTSKIVLDSLWRAKGERVRLVGLMDNRQTLVPFANLKLLGARWDPDTYQYHQLAFGLAGARPKEYVHGLVTTLKTALIHPIALSAPLDLATATWFSKNVHGALGIVNVNLHDTRREESWLELATGDGERTKLVARYEPAPSEPADRKRALARIKRALWQLGCFVPPGMAHVRPMGASVHYSGTLPMSTKRAPLTVDRDCRSHDFSNLWIADGATFPFLPAKNLTFTLMANAARIATKLG